MGCHFLLQGIFWTQGSNPDLPHCRQLLSCLNHQGSSNPNPNSNPKGRSDQATSSKSKPFRASLELSPQGAVSTPSPGSLHSPTLSHRRAWVRVVSAGGCALPGHPWAPASQHRQCCSWPPDQHSPAGAPSTRSSYPTTTVCPSHGTGNPQQQGLFLHLLTSLNVSTVNECWTKGWMSAQTRPLRLPAWQDRRRPARASHQHVGKSQLPNAPSGSGGDWEKGLHLSWGGGGWGR